LKRGEMSSLAQNLLANSNRYSGSMLKGLTPPQREEFLYFVGWLEREMQGRLAFDKMLGCDMVTSCKASFLWGMEFGMNLDLANGEFVQRQGEPERPQLRAGRKLLRVISQRGKQ